MNRRRFLSIAAAPALLAPIAAAAAPNLFAEPAPVLSPRFADFAAQLAEAITNRDAAEEAFAKAMASASDAPAVPEALLRGDGYWFGPGAPELDIADSIVCDSRGYSRRVLHSDDLRLDVADYGPRTKMGKEARRLLGIAEEYERKRIEVQQRTRVVELSIDRARADRAVDFVAEEMLKVPALNVSDIFLKASAMRVSCMRNHGHISAHAAWTGPILANDILAVMRPQP